MTATASSFAKENFLPPHLRLGCLSRIKPPIDPELGSRRKVQQFLKLRHEVNLTPPFQNVNAFFRGDDRIAVKISSPLFEFGEIFD